MMPKVLIISPYFPPANTADMQRVRMSLPYFKQYGWEAEVMTVENKHTDTQQDKLLVQSVPTQIMIHEVHEWVKNGLQNWDLEAWLSDDNHFIVNAPTENKITPDHFSSNAPIKDKISKGHISDDKKPGNHA